MQERKRMLDARTFAQKKDQYIVLDAAVLTGFAPLAVAVAAEWRKVKAATDPIRLQEVLDMAALDKARYDQEMQEWLATRGSVAVPEQVVGSGAKIDGLVHVTDEESLSDDESNTTLDAPMTKSDDLFGDMKLFTESGMPIEFVHAETESALSQKAIGSFSDPNFLPKEISMGEISTVDGKDKPSTTGNNHCRLEQEELMDSGGDDDEDLDYEPFPLDQATKTASALQNWLDVGRLLAL
jgi:hypothetical protein